MERLEEKLTEKQKAFCDYYIESLNATEAYRKAYNCEYDTAKVNAAKLLTKTNIKEYINARMSDIKKDRIATVEDVMEFLSNVLTGKEEKATLKDRLKAAELLGKRYAMFTEKVEVEGDMEMNVNIKVIE